MLLEDDTILTRVIHYIHLNPVRANIVAPRLFDIPLEHAAEGR